MRRQKTIIFLLILSILAEPLAVLAQDVDPGFNAGVLISDASFQDTQTFGGAAGIQRFLESKQSILANTDPNFLVKLNEPSDPTLKQELGDPEPNLGRLRTAAELIWDASQSSGLNPQVILVTMNKEQSLITGPVDPSRLQTALNHAMGFACPDGSGCGNLFPGFYYQLFGNIDTSGNRYIGAAKSLMRSFATPGGRGPEVDGAPAQVGQSITIENTIGNFVGILSEQLVTISNLATAALYRYTPHVFNGNYNFWKFFTEWFKYPNGTLLRSSPDNTIYIIEDGLRQQVPNFVALARNLNLNTAITASPTELGNYSLGAIYSPPDNTVASVGGTLFVFLNNIMHPVTNFVLKQRKLDPTKSLPMSTDDAGLFVLGPELTPLDGTVLRAQTGKDVYIVVSGVLKLFSPFTFRQYAVAKKVQIVPDGDVAVYPKLGYVAPLKGTLIKSKTSGGLYVMGDGIRLPLTAELFKNLGYRTKDVVTLSSDAEMASLPLGAPPTPRDGTFFNIADSSELYLFKDGAKHPIFPFVAKQRHITADYSFEASIVSNWSDGIAIPPLDGTLVKSNLSSTVYIVANGQLRPLTAALFKNLGLSTKKIVTLPDNQVSAFATDGYATPHENTYFAVNETGALYVFKAGAKHRIYPFVATQRGMTPDYTFGADAAKDWPDGTPIPPREGTLLEAANTTTVYLVSLGKLRSLTTIAFKRRGISLKNVHVVSQDQIDGLPKGDPILK